MDMEHEELHVRRGSRTGVPIAVALHSTQAGPAIGGCRVTTYPGWRDGVEDVLELARAMTVKCALAGLPHGGGKTVVALDEAGPAPERAALLADLAELISSLRGRYLTGPDIGTTPDDMRRLHDLTGGLAFCRPREHGGCGNSSTATARGVLAALGVGVRQVFERDSLAGLRVGVIGYGSVGSLVARSLAGSGARVLVTDIRPDLHHQVRLAGLGWRDSDLTGEDLDILVPAANGGLLTRAAVARCRARLIVGPANNQLAQDDIQTALSERGITWIPDVITSAGGIIHAVCREELGLSDDATGNRIDAIATTTAELFTEMRATGTPPLQAAHTLAARARQRVTV